MSTLAAPLSCPSCGAPAPFRSAAPYAVCSHCQSLLVRKDASVDAIGKVAAVADDYSPLQVGTRGRFEMRDFTLVGRLRKVWDEGSWNEWCAAFDDRRFGWLAEAQGDLVMTFARPGAPAPAAGALALGAQLRIDGQDYLVSDRKRVDCQGAQGELARGDVQAGAMESIDLRGPGSAFATWEIGAGFAHLFVGRYVDFEECGFTGLRALDGWAPPGGAGA